MKGSSGFAGSPEKYGCGNFGIGIGQKRQQ
jgi:hypothetical protein